jgi:hypothetical protein
MERMRLRSLLFDSRHVEQDPKSEMQKFAVYSLDGLRQSFCIAGWSAELLKRDRTTSFASLEEE